MSHPNDTVSVWTTGRYFAGGNGTCRIVDRADCEYEERRYPIRKATPQQTLQHLMEARQVDPERPLEDSVARITSEVFQGKRSISKRRPRKLAAFSMSARPVHLALPPAPHASVVKRAGFDFPSSPLRMSVPELR